MTRPTPPDRLDPAERALADLLPPPQRQGPLPASDAAILAAARAAAAARTPGTGTDEQADAPRPTGSGAPVASKPSGASNASAHGRRRRSPAWLRGGALAATVVLAVGVAWQLRPTLDAPVAIEAASEAPPHPTVPAAVADAAPAEAAGVGDTGTPPTSATDPAPIERTSAAVAREAEAAQRKAADANADARRSRSAPAPATPPPPQEPPVMFDAPVAAPAVAIPPPAPPASPAPPAPPVPAAQPAPRADEAISWRALQAAPPPEARARREAANAEAGDGHWLDQPMDDTPPASVDSPAVREAWLARIHDLVAAERYEEARESYAEFRRRHPDAPVPDDLRILLGDE